MKNQGRLFVAALLFVATNAHAQFDELDDNFAPPPPPPGNFQDFSPPAPGGSTGSAPSGAASGAASGSTSGSLQDGTLTSGQKDKFAKAAIEDITEANFPETIDSFDFPNADIQDIVKAISELTGKNFIVDPGVRGKITIIAPSKISVAAAYKAFLSALAINGYAVVPSGSFLKIRTARNAQRDGIETYSGAYFPNADQMVTKIIHLKHISSEAVNRDLRILQSKDGEMSPYPPTNSLIISDYGSNIERITRILNQLDVPGFEDQLEVIQVRFAKAKDMAELIMKIVNRGEQQQPRGGTFTAGVPRFGRTATNNQGNQGSAYFMVIPDERTNGLIVTGNKAGLERIRRLLSQLDRRIEAGEAGGVYVYYVKYGDAEKIAQTLAGVAKDAAPKPAAQTGAPNISPVSGVQATTQEIFGGDVKITADKTTNSLVVISSKQDYETVLSLLRKIDIQRDQVYVEAIIMEMSGNVVDDYQVGFFQYIGNNGIKAGFNGIDNDRLSSLLNPVGGSGVILPFGDPNSRVSITPLIPGAQAIEVPSLLGFINFLKQNRNGNVLSSPQILALDAQEASIVVGDKVVIGTSAIAGVNGSAAVETPQFEDANLELKVKPFISPEDQNIRIDFEASLKQISNVRTPVALQSKAQPLSTRKIKTNIMIRNGDTAVLGGLTKEDEQESITKVPLLGDIPILGWLFKSRTVSRGKVNLNIFLTPRIIRSRDDSKRLLGRKMEQRLDYIKSTGGRDPFGATMDDISGVTKAPAESTAQ